MSKAVGETKNFLILQGKRLNVEVAMNEVVDLCKRPTIELTLVYLYTPDLP